MRYLSDDVMRLWRTADGSRAWIHDLLTTGWFWTKGSILWLIRAIVPFIECYDFECRQRRRIAQEEETVELGTDWQCYLTLDLDSLKSCHALELSRRELILKRAQANLITVTLAISFVFGIIGVLTKAPTAASNGRATQEQIHAGFQAANLLSGAILMLVVLTVLFMLMSALCAMRVIGQDKLYDMWLQNRGIQWSDAPPEDDEKLKYVKMIKLNQARILIMSNYATASHQGMTNGVVIIALALILLVGRIFQW